MIDIWSYYIDLIHFNFDRFFLN